MREDVQVGDVARLVTHDAEDGVEKLETFRHRERRVDMLEILGCLLCE